MPLGFFQEFPFTLDVLQFEYNMPEYLFFGICSVWISFACWICKLVFVFNFRNVLARIILHISRAPLSVSSPLILQLCDFDLLKLSHSSWIFCFIFFSFFFYLCFSLGNFYGHTFKLLILQFLLIKT